MTRTFLSLYEWLLLIFCTVLLISCSRDEQVHPLTRFEITPSSLHLSPGEHFAIKQITIEPSSSNYIEQDIRWKIGDSSIANFDAEALTVTALAPGKTSLEATLSNLKAVVEIIVDESVNLTGVEFSEASYSGYVGDHLQVSIRPIPADAEISAGHFLVANEDLATISQDGSLTLLKPGRSQILYEAQGQTFEAPLTIKQHLTLLNASPQILVGSKITLDISGEYPLEKGEPLEVVISDTTKLQMSDAETLTLAARSEGAVTIEFRNSLAEGHASLEVVYPRELILPPLDWTMTLADLAQYEKEHGGTAEGGVKHDEELDMDYYDYNVRVEPLQPIPFRRYYISGGKLSKSMLLYHKDLCFNDRGGGMGGFKSAFTALLSQAGFSEPKDIGQGAFLSVNTEKKLLLVIQLMSMREEYYFSLTFMENPY